jgi:hypothetical protein
MSNFALPERLFPMCYDKICLISVSCSFFSYPVNPVDPVKVLRSVLLAMRLKMTHSVKIENRAYGKPLVPRVFSLSSNFSFIFIKGFYFRHIPLQHIPPFQFHGLGQHAVFR